MPHRTGESTARNHRFYGLVAGEWHSNHHRFPRSARTGLSPGQLDVPFLFIRLLHRLGVVASYQEATAEEPAAPRVPGRSGDGSQQVA